MPTHAELIADRRRYFGRLALSILLRALEGQPDPIGVAEARAAVTALLNEPPPPPPPGGDGIVIVGEPEPGQTIVANPDGTYSPATLSGGGALTGPEDVPGLPEALAALQAAATAALRVMDLADWDDLSFLDQEVPVWDAATETFVGAPSAGNELAQVVLAANAVHNQLGGANRVDMANMPVLNFVMPNKPVEVRMYLPTVTSDVANRNLTATLARASDSTPLCTWGKATLAAAAGIPSYEFFGKFDLRPGVANNGVTYNPGDAVALKLRVHHSAGGAMSSTIFAGVVGGGAPAVFEAVAK